MSAAHGANPVEPSARRHRELDVTERSPTATDASESSSLFQDGSTVTLPAAKNAETPTAVLIKPAKLPTVPGYEIRAELGRGGMGVVYRAYHLGLQRQVALKMVRSGEHADESELHRFLDEARKLAALSHPHIVPIYDIGAYDGLPYFAMEFLDGGPLSDQLKHGPLPAVEAAKFIEVVARAVEYAHQMGILHRDLKPSNILLKKKADGPPRSEDPVVTTPARIASPAPPDRFFVHPLASTNYSPKITDFGLARHFDGSFSPWSTETIVGTPSYMAPEQATGPMGPGVTPASDVYSLGAILYELLAGKPPFRADTPLATLLEALEKEPVPPSRFAPGIPRELEAICLHCLEKEPSRRYPSASALADDLRRFVDRQPIRVKVRRGARQPRRWTREWRAILALTACLALFAGLVRWQRPSSDSSTASLAYVHAVNQAQSALHQNQANRVFQIMDATEPSRRGWEFGYLSHGARQQLAGECAVRRAPLAALVVSPKGDLFACGGSDGLVHLHHLPSNQLVHSFNDHTDAVVALAFSPAGDLLASASHDRTARIRRADTKSGVWVLQGHQSGVSAVAFSPDGRRLATGSHDSTIRVWDMDSGESLRTLTRHHDAISGLAFSPNGVWLASASHDGTIYLWDGTAGNGSTYEYRPAQSVASHQGGASAIAFSPDSNLLASVGQDRTVRLWDVAARCERRAAMTHPRAVRCLAFHPNGQEIATGCEDRSVQVWNLNAEPAKAVGESTARFSGHRAAVTAVAYLGNNVLSASEDGTVRVWNESRDHGRVLGRHDSAVRRLVFHPREALLASTSRDCSSRLWNLRSGRSTPLSDHGDFVHQVAISPDGQEIATASFDQSVVVRAAGTNELLQTVPATARVLGVAYCPVHRVLAASCADGVVMLWDLNGQREIGTIQASDEAASDVAFSADGSLLAVASFDGEVSLWDVETRKLVRRFLGHTYRVVRVVFSPDGRTIATASFDKSARIWDVDSGKERARLTDHTAKVTDVSFHPDGRRLATASQDGTVRIWDFATGQSLLTLDDHSSGVNAVAFSPAGDLLVTGGLDHTIRVYGPFSK
jgi:WD40 repeat protein/serine/threonine protein kinase